MADEAHKLTPETREQIRSFVGGLFVLPGIIGGIVLFVLGFFANTLVQQANKAEEQGLERGHESGYAQAYPEALRLLVPDIVDAAGQAEVAQQQALDAAAAANTAQEAASRNLLAVIAARNQAEGIVGDAVPGITAALLAQPTFVPAVADAVTANVAQLEQQLHGLGIEVQRVEGPVAYNCNAALAIEATCPAGYTLVGGGYENQCPNLFVAESRMLSSGGVPAWRVSTARLPGFVGEPPSTAQYKVEAICVRLSPGGNVTRP